MLYNYDIMSEVDRLVFHYEILALSKDLPRALGLGDLGRTVSR